MVNGTKCMACLKRFCTQYYAKSHYKDVHLRTKYLCHRCPRFFPSLNNLERHYTKAHESECESVSIYEEKIVRVVFPVRIRLIPRTFFCYQDDSTDSSVKPGGSCRSSTGTVTMGTICVSFFSLHVSYIFFPTGRQHSLIG